MIQFMYVYEKDIHHIVPIGKKLQFEIAALAWYMDDLHHNY